MWEQLMEFRVPKNLGLAANLNLPKNFPSEEILRISLFGILDNKIALRSALGANLGFNPIERVPSATGTRVRLHSKS